MFAGGYLVYTNPSEENLRKEIEAYIITEVEKSLPSSAVNDGYASNLIHLNINQSIIITDFYFYKRVTYIKNNNAQVIGYGYLNKFHGKK
jgi:predicted nucleotidyltransferase